jgi:hypothetical protein
MTCLLMDKPNNEWIVVPPMNSVAMWIVCWKCEFFVHYLVLEKKILDGFDDLCFSCFYNTSYML